MRTRFSSCLKVFRAFLNLVAPDLWASRKCESSEQQDCMYPYLVVVVFAVGPDAFPDSRYWFPPSTVFSKQRSYFPFQIIARAICLWTLIVAFGEGRLESDGVGFQLFAIAFVFG